MLYEAAPPTEPLTGWATAGNRRAPPKCGHPGRAGAGGALRPGAVVRAPGGDALGHAHRHAPAPRPAAGPGGVGARGRRARGGVALVGPAAGVADAGGGLDARVAQAAGPEGGGG